MALQVFLRLLSLVLLLFMHGHGTNARDMKVQELVEQEQGNQPSIKDQDHPSEDDSYPSQYKAAYRPREHMHPMHQQDHNVRVLHPRYSTAAAWFGSGPAGRVLTFRKHIHRENQKEVGKPYITAYGNSKSKSEKDSENSQPSTFQFQYIAYDNSKSKSEKDSENSQKDSKEKNQPNYFTVYGNSEENTQKDTSDQDSNYITVYGGKRESSKVDHTEAFKTGFFALDDIYVGNTMTLQFPVEDFAHFLSRKEADSIPFSTSQLASVLQLFSVTEDSYEGKAMRNTLERCEQETARGETKACVTSLESMIEYVQSILGTEDKYNILTSSYPSESSASLQKYTIVKVSEDIYAPKWVACHPMPYPYAVFFCHFIDTGSKVFKVTLAGENGDKMEALGICHMDTSDWNPNHILFQQLGFKPGDAPVCHFYPAKHLLWVPLPSKTTM